MIPYDKWSHERIRGLLTYMRYTNRRILYFTTFFHGPIQTAPHFVYYFNITSQSGYRHALRGVEVEG